MKLISRKMILNILWFGFIVIALGVWQTRHARTGIAPQFSLENLGGESKQVPSADQKIKIIYFFAPWCGVCKASMGNLAWLHSWISGLEIAVVGLDYESVEQIKDEAAHQNLTPNVFLGNDAVRDGWGLEGYPTYVVLGKGNQIRATSVGYSSLFGMIFRAFWVKAVD